MLAAKERTLNCLYDARDVGLVDETAAVIAKQIKETRVEIEKLTSR